MQRVSLTVLSQRDQAARDGAGGVTALASAVEIDELRDTSRQRGRHVVELPGSVPPQHLCTAVLAALPLDHAVSRAWDVAATAAGLDRHDLAVALRLREGDERATWIRSWATNDRGRVAAWLCSSDVDGTEPVPGELSLDWFRVIAAAASLVLPTGPAVILHASAADPAACHEAARLAAKLIAVAPSLVVAVAAPANVLHRYLAEWPESSAKARLRQGLLDWPLTVEPPDDDDPLAPDPSAAHLNVDPELAERARSQAEAALFAALEADARTSGRFALNTRISATFGGRNTEIDLACRDCHLAVEVDGYHHFRTADDYRRDRRKDLVLQLHGWVVLRVLADDVADDLTTVVDTIATTLTTLSKGATATP